MSGTTTSLWPDSEQLTRIHNMFPGRMFRYLPGRVEPDGTVHDYYGVIETSPTTKAVDAERLAMLRAEIGALSITLVLGDKNWQPPK